MQRHRGGRDLTWATRSEEGGQDREKQEVKWGKVEGDGRRRMTGWLKALGLQ